MATLTGYVDYSDEAFPAALRDRQDVLDDAFDCSNGGLKADYLVAGGGAPNFQLVSQVSYDALMPASHVSIGAVKGYQTSRLAHHVVAVPPPRSVALELQACTPPAQIVRTQHHAFHHPPVTTRQPTWGQPITSEVRVPTPLSAQAPLTTNGSATQWSPAVKLAPMDATTSQCFSPHSSRATTIFQLHQTPTHCTVVNLLPTVKLPESTDRQLETLMMQLEQQQKQQSQGSPESAAAAAFPPAYEGGCLSSPASSSDLSTSTEAPTSAGACGTIFAVPRSLLVPSPVQQARGVHSPVSGHAPLTYSHQPADRVGSVNGPFMAPSLSPPERLYSQVMHEQQQQQQQRQQQVYHVQQQVHRSPVLMQAAPQQQVQQVHLSPVQPVAQQQQPSPCKAVTMPAAALLPEQASSSKQVAKAAKPPAATTTPAVTSAALKKKGGKRRNRSRQEIAVMAATAADGTRIVRKPSKRQACYNCGAHNTPQWRCGPDGPRTLCNACGVRYKKGLPLAYWEAKVAAGLVPSEEPLTAPAPVASEPPVAANELVQAVAEPLAGCDDEGMLTLAQAQACSHRA